MKYTAELGGGLEILFGGQKVLEVESDVQLRLKEFLLILKDRFLQERPELLLSGATV
jgi:hypothetical protein